MGLKTNTIIRVLFPLILQIEKGSFRGALALIAHEPITLYHRSSTSANTSISIGRFSPKQLVYAIARHSRYTSRRCTLSCFVSLTKIASAVYLTVGVSDADAVCREPLRSISYGCDSGLD